MKKEELEYVYGIHSVIELLESGKDIEAIYVNRGTKGPRLTELRKLIKQKGVPSKDLPQQAFNKFGNKNHQGVVASISPIEFHELDPFVESVLETKEAPLFLLLDTSIPSPLSFIISFG